MKTNRISELPVWILAGCFVVQTFFLSTSTKPRDVLQAVNVLRLDLVSSIQQALTDIAEIHIEMEKRGSWMKAVDLDLENRTRDRVFRSEVSTMLEQLAAENPELKVPTLPDLEYKAGPPTLQRGRPESGNDLISN